MRAPDGTLLYLVQQAADGRTIYDSDFHLVPEEQPAPLLTTVDHIAQALPMGRMDHFVWRYIVGC